MKIEDVLEGKRVRVISDSHYIIPIGAIGTLIESHSVAPYIDFDEYHEGCFEYEGYLNVRALEHDEIEEI